MQEFYNGGGGGGEIKKTKYFTWRSEYK